MRPKIDAEPTFDPLQLFTSEGPVEGTKTTRYCSHPVAANVRSR